MAGRWGMSGREEQAAAKERGEVGIGWWLFSVLAAFALAWWLAVRTMALRVGSAAATALPAGEVGAKAKVLTLQDRADDFLTVKELEKHLPLCGKSIRREISEGKLPSHRMRGKVTVKGSDALAWLSARREDALNAENA